MTPEVTRTNPQDIDYGWIMQVTFVTSIVIGAPLVALLSVPVTLDTWTERVQFVVAIGSMVWFAVAIVVSLYARQNRT